MLPLTPNTRADLLKPTDILLADIHVGNSGHRMFEGQGRETWEGHQLYVSVQEVVMYCVYSEEMALSGSLDGTVAANPPVLGNKKFIYPFKCQYTHFFSLFFFFFLNFAVIHQNTHHLWTKLCAA